MKDKITKVGQEGFMPILKSRCIVIVVLLAVMAILYSSYLTGLVLDIAYGVTTLIILSLLGLHQNWRFQKIHRRLRPYIVLRILQAVSSLGYLAILFFTYQEVGNQITAYIVFWVIGLAAVYQFYAIFHLASLAKEAFPDRCEFC
ncbi:MAG: hypothetical protein OEY44_00675 [Candidatus Peregrinibacteria bacterium]|nr:hypothetical protein [Candidatus Peregrinibacteria bacterium]